MTISFGDRTLDVSWSQPRYEGSPVRRYEVSYNGRTVTTNGAQRSIELKGLENGTPYRVRVRGVNDAETERDGVMGAGAWSTTVSEYPNGEPGAPTGVSIDPDGPDADPSAVISWSPIAENGHPVERTEVRRTGAGAVSCARLSDTSCRVDLAAGQDASFQVRGFNRDNPKVGAIDGWGPWSASTATVRGATPPGAVTNLQAVPTGQSGQARVTFGEAARNGAEEIRYEYAVGGTGRGAITSGAVIGGLPNGSQQNVEVWAVSKANGKESAPGPRSGDTVSAFAPCTVSVWKISENYDNVTFGWTVTPQGRSCGYTGSPNNNPNGNTSSTQTGQTNVGSGPNQNVSFTLTVRTNTSGEDPSVGNASQSASGSTWRQGIDWSEGPSGCTSFTNCHWASLQLTDFKPNSNVRCFISGDGAGDWSATYRVNGSGDIFVQKTWQYQKGGPYNPNMYDGQACTQQ